MRRTTAPTSQYQENSHDRFGKVSATANYYADSRRREQRRRACRFYGVRGEIELRRCCDGEMRRRSCPQKDKRVAEGTKVVGRRHLASGLLQRAHADSNERDSKLQGLERRRGSQRARDGARGASCSQPHRGNGRSIGHHGWVGSSGTTRTPRARSSTKSAITGDKSGKGGKQ